MLKYKICFWLNVPSNHQTLFLEELNNSKQIDLMVYYFDKPAQNHLVLGWRDKNSLYYYEKYVVNINETINTITDFSERIHIVIGYGFSFNKKLIPILIENNIFWVHWSERYGAKLAEKVHFNMALFELLRPFFLWTKHSYGKLVNNYAIGCFSQGYLAKKDFISLGIDSSKIANLFYTPSPIVPTDQIPKDLKDFNYRYKFLYIGTLSKRKGTKDLLKAFSILNNKLEWGLVLVGQDLSNGKYKRMAKALGIAQETVFVNAVSESNLNKFYHNCDVFILPSRFDGWGAVINEAASAGLPIIGSNQCGSSFHLIKYNVNGYIFKAGRVKELSGWMQHYILHPELIKKHGNASLSIYKKFTPKQNCMRFISAISKWTAS